MNLKCWHIAKYTFSGELKTYNMQSSNYLKRDLKMLAVVNIATAVLMILFSMAGHFLTPYKLIPASVIGGTTGLVIGVYLCFKLNYIARKNFLLVLLSSLIYFGAMSFVAVFNLHTPVVIIVGFSLTGFSTILSNHYFANYQNYSKNQIYGKLGLILAFPALYFIVASILKVKFGNNSLFGLIDNLLNRTNGQENFNAITPFIFGGGLVLAFGLNLFSQIENFRITNIFNYKSLRFRFKALNFFVVLLTGFLGLTILSYLAFENL